MPIYEYKCLKCNEEFEALVFGSKDKVVCSRCKGDRLERLMSTCTFKGSAGSSPSSGPSGCGTCTSTNCSSCH